MARSPKVKTCFAFATQALAAAEFYVSLLPDSRIDKVGRSIDELGIGPKDGVLAVEFTLAGTPYQAINGGPSMPHSEGASISVATEDQAETDRLWAALTENGGQEVQCGWLKDRFGLSWQIVPRRALELLSGPDAAKVWPVYLKMRKVDIAALEASVA